MNYLSLFSGIEAASVAWEPLGWRPLAFAEIEPFPAAVLAHRFPEVPNLSDVTRFKDWRINGTVNLIVGGSPCQSFSVAGLRKGMDDPRGNLALTYLAIVAKYQPEWVVWENVPGVLSSNGGRDFGSFLGALASLGYGFAWRVLDAQSVRSRRFPRAVPQRRRRLFVVGNLRDVRRSGAVLFDSQSFGGNSPSLRKEKKRYSVFTPSSFGGYREGFGTLKANGGDIGGGSENLIVTASCKARRLMPVECERLQGFPDDWTRIPYRGKDADQCPDGPRYKAIGNSMAVNVMEWIGERIDFVNGLFNEAE